MKVLILLASMFVVFIAALLFVNAIEYLGCRLRLGGSFVGAILAPLFTSFPEMTVFLVAVFFSGAAAGEAIGIGTLFGQPFMASSLSYGLVGIAALLGFLFKRRQDLFLEVDRTLIIPYAFITALFPLTLVPALVGFHFFFGLLFLFAYLGYVYMMYLRRAAETIEDATDPYICRMLPRPVLGSAVQLIVAILLLYIGSHQMVSSVDSMARSMGLSAMGLALIIIPAATAVPETASALIWGYRGRDTLSIGALVGEKILYSTFYPGLGLLLTSWVLDLHAYFSVAVTTIVSLILLYYIVRRRIPWYGLCFGLFFFIAYAVVVFARLLP